MVHVKVCKGGQGRVKAPFGGLCRCGVVFPGKTVAFRELLRKRRKKTFKTTMHWGREEDW